MCGGGSRFGASPGRLRVASRLESVSVCACVCVRLYVCVGTTPARSRAHAVRVSHRHAPHVGPEYRRVCVTGEASAVYCSVVHFILSITLLSLPEPEARTSNPRTRLVIRRGPRARGF